MFDTAELMVGRIGFVERGSFDDGFLLTDINPTDHGIPVTLPIPEWQALQVARNAFLELRGAEQNRILLHLIDGRAKVVAITDVLEPWEITKNLDGSDR